MRWIIGLLLVFNVVLLLWNVSIVKPRKETVEVQTVDSNVKSIQLVRELNDSSLPRVESKSVVSEVEEEVISQLPEETSGNEKKPHIPEVVTEELSEPVSEMPLQPAQPVTEPEQEEVSLPETLELSEEPVEQLVFCGRYGPFDGEQDAQRVLDRLDME